MKASFICGYKWHQGNDDGIYAINKNEDIIGISSNYGFNRWFNK